MKYIYRKKKGNITIDMLRNKGMDEKVVKLKNHEAKERKLTSIKRRDGSKMESKRTDRHTDQRAK